MSSSTDFGDNDPSDGIATKGGLTITSGTIVMDNVYGDGIQTKGNFIMTGGNLKITTYYEYAGVNFYNSSTSSYVYKLFGTYNTLSKNETTSTKTETAYYDTGSHKGIKAGTKAETYSYTSVADGSTNVANTEYTTEASGGSSAATATASTSISSSSGAGGGGGAPGGGNMPGR